MEMFNTIDYYVTSAIVVMCVCWALVALVSQFIYFLQGRDWDEPGVIQYNDPNFKQEWYFFKHPYKHSDMSGIGCITLLLTVVSFFAIVTSGLGFLFVVLAVRAALNVRRKNKQVRNAIKVISGDS